MRETRLPAPVVKPVADGWHLVESQQDYIDYCNTIGVNPGFTRRDFPFVIKETPERYETLYFDDIEPLYEALKKAVGSDR